MHRKEQRRVAHASKPLLIDFHSHYYDPAWLPAETPRGYSAAMTRARAMLTDIDAQLDAMTHAGVDMKVLSAPLSTLVGAGEQPPVELTARINDRFAALVAQHPNHLLGMATIDAFGGEVAAREVERAVRTLGLRGICVDCARGEWFLNAPEARPVLDAAASLHVPIFVHPVSPAGYAEHLAQHGQPGVLMARGTETAASILSLVRNSVLAAMPGLTIVIPMMAASVLLFAGLIDQEEEHTTGEGGGQSDVLKRLYVDTMGFGPTSVRFAVDAVGVEHVLVGSDWPILPIPARDRVERCLIDAQIGLDERAAMCSKNAQRLLRA